MSLKRALGIIIGFIVLAALVFGLVAFVRARFMPAKKVITSSNVPSASVSAAPAVDAARVFQNPSGSASSTPASSTTDKVYSSNGVNFHYPSNWGLLTCDNSQNFEFDPTNGADSKVACDRALKSVTVVVGSVEGCGGLLLDLGSTRVQKNKTQTATLGTYRWCFVANNTRFNVTHRVATTGARATSKDDISAQVEQMISKIGR